jgi:hypothetical protein
MVLFGHGATGNVGLHAQERSDALSSLGCEGASSFEQHNTLSKPPYSRKTDTSLTAGYNTLVRPGFVRPRLITLLCRIPAGGLYKTVMALLGLATRHQYPLGHVYTSA